MRTPFQNLIIESVHYNTTDKHEKIYKQRINHFKITKLLPFQNIFGNNTSFIVIKSLLRIYLLIIKSIFFFLYGTKYHKYKKLHHK